VSVRVCSVDELPVGVARRFSVDGREVAIVNLGEDGVHALDAVCSHEHAWLDEGEVDTDEGTIECPKHGSTFDVATGKALTLPAIAPVASFPVSVDGDEIWIEV
jgi:3-phenylpropionate/trans-cinnamate dioxygenase ferredoxin component